MNYKRRLQEFCGDADIIELLKGTSTTLALKIAGILFSYAFYITLARMYGAEVMGILTLTMTVASIFSLFALVGTQTATVRFVSENASQGNYGTVSNVYKKTLLLVLPLSMLVAFILFFLSPVLADDVFHKPSLIMPFKIIAFSIPLSALITINTESLRGLKRIRDSFVFQTVVPPLLNSIGLVLLTYFAVRNYLTPIFTNAITAVIGALLTTLIWIKKVESYPVSKEQKRVSINDILRVSLPMFITSAMLLIMGWTDVFMLGMFRSSGEVGVYQIALKTALLSSFTLVAVNSIAAPKIAALFWNSEMKRLKKVVKSSSKFIFWSSFPVFLVIVIFSKEILNLFGEEFIIGQSALIILSAGQFINAFCGPVGYLLNMTGKENTFKNTMLIGAALNIILNLVLIPYWGILGAALATAISTSIWNINASRSAYKHYGYWSFYIPHFIKLK